MDRVEALRALVRMSRLLEGGAGGLSLAHYRVLAAVADGHQRASHVAARLALGRPTISASVDALCRRGLLERAQDTGDQRVVALRLTELGRAELQAAEAGMLDRLDAVLTRSGNSDAAVATLAELGKALDRLSAERLVTRA